MSELSHSITSASYMNFWDNRIRERDGAVFLPFARDGDGVEVLDVSDPNNPRHVDVSETMRVGHNLVVGGGASVESGGNYVRS